MLSLAVQHKGHFHKSVTSSDFLFYFLHLSAVYGTDGVSTAPQWPLHPPHTPLPGGLSWHRACVDHGGTYCNEYYLYLLFSSSTFSLIRFFFLFFLPTLFSSLIPFPFFPSYHILLFLLSSLLSSLLPLLLLFFHLLSCPHHTFTWHTFVAK